MYDEWTESWPALDELNLGEENSKRSLFQPGDR